MSRLIGGWFDHRRAPAVAWVTVIAFAAVWTATFGYQQRRTSDNQQQIIRQQQLIEGEVDARIAAVCETALDTRAIIREVIGVLEGAASPQSALRDAAVRERLAAVVTSRPVQCETTPEPPARLQPG